MRATRTLTWLLLSFSLLFHGVSSTEEGRVVPTVAMVTPGGTTRISTAIERKSEALTTPTGTTAAPEAVEPPENPAKTTNAPITSTPIKTVASTTTTHSTTLHPTSNSPKAVSIQESDTTPGTTVTSSLPKTTTAATSQNSNTVVVVPSPTVQVSGSSEPSATSEPSGKVEQTITVTVTTAPQQRNSPTTIQVSIPLTTSQEVSKGSEETPKVTTLQATQPAGKQHHTTEITTTTTTQTTTPTPTTSSQTKTGPFTEENVTTTPGTTSPLSTTSTMTTVPTTAAPPKTFVYSLHNPHQAQEQKNLVEVCKRLMSNWQNGTCTLMWRHHNDKVLFDAVEINGKVNTSLAAQYYEEITKKPTDNKTLIAILASCGALLIMIVILAVCASHHRKPYNENQQHLTEELHTVENGYHDNPTLEVMEVQPEMQEKKVALNGEFNDSWIVPIDNLLKEDMPDEEDTHL
ncbi:podocalyxin [Parambassis ranga]|uniref:Podocalyxin n=1 Tax=Parambassis ranga TaxID=210632 RepID=A0A6P7HWR1_9TELE|nr:podocalyxin [Parambassis ranga]